MQFPRFTLTKQADYINIRCMEHPDEFAQMKYASDDGAVPAIEISCPKCGTLGPIKCGGFSRSNELKQEWIEIGEAKHLPKN
jgi:hypothetical protein